MDNIDLFNEACVIIFKKLYESFPVPIDFYQNEVGFYKKTDTTENSNLRRKVLHETLIFLEAENYITFTFNPDGNAHVLNARLTSKGLAKLQRIPTGIQNDSKSLIKQLSDATASISDKAASTAISEAVSKVLALIFA